MLAEWVFWSCLAALFLAYAGYPLILALLVRLLGRRPRRTPGEPGGSLPALTLAVPARNEAHQIAEKVRDCLQADYPGHLFEILVMDDGSTDGTAELAREAADRWPKPQGPRLGVVRLPGGGGKAAVLNAASARAQGEILAFSDADCRIAPDALRILAAHFADPAVGCVAARYSAGLGSARPNAYWRYEDFVRRRESDLGGILGASGALYAIRRESFVPLPSGLINDDFVVPMRLRLAGYRTLYEPRARATELQTTDRRASEREEMARRVRIMVGNCQHLALFWRLLPAARRRWAPAAQMACHKLLRVASPLFLAGLGVSSLSLSLGGRWPYAAALAAQVGFYVLAALGTLTRRPIPGPLAPLLTWPRYFTMLNAAAAVGVFRFLAQGERVAWGRRNGECGPASR